MCVCGSYFPHMKKILGETKLSAFSFIFLMPVAPLSRSVTTSGFLVSDVVSRNICPLDRRLIFSLGIIFYFNSIFYFLRKHF